jgi:hypothetical protein
MFQANFEPYLRCIDFRLKYMADSFCCLISSGFNQNRIHPIAQLGIQVLEKGTSLLHLLRDLKPMYMMAHSLAHCWLLVLLLATVVFASDTFHSLDKEVRIVIANCTTTVEALPFNPDKSRCQATLQCILNGVDAATSARWSAGASILAFIPTLAALMSNSIDDLVLIAEDSLILAIFLALCSVTTFVPRFGRHSETPRELNAIKEELDYSTKKAFEDNQKSLCSLRKTQRLVILAVAIGFLVAGCAIIWYPVYQIQRNGIVVFSCQQRIHIVIWVVLVQMTAVANILLKPFTIENRTIPLNLQRKGSEKHGPRKISVVLRCTKQSIAAKTIRGFTSVLSLALYTYATGVLGAMTMYPASDAIRALVMFAVAAGVGRIIGSWAVTRHSRWKKAIAINVRQRHMKQLKQYVEDLVQ